VHCLKVKSVLEALSILLSDRSSPFVCIIAIDSRIAIQCFEYNKDGDQPNVNGHEYLKKIINVPFCLPEVCRLCNYYLKFAVAAFFSVFFFIKKTQYEKYFCLLEVITHDC